uniref:Uncharacterized protein n=1 Tax=Arundo donax TaxID=35708 RepID=A0A0A8Z5Z2_ARUDO
MLAQLLVIVLSDHCLRHGVRVRVPGEFARVSYRGRVAEAQQWRQGDGGSVLHGLLPLNFWSI